MGMIWLWTWLVIKKKKAWILTSYFPFLGCCFRPSSLFLVFRQLELCEMDLFWWGSQWEPPWTRSGTELSFLGEPGVFCRARRWCCPGSPLHRASASPTSSTPLNWGLMVIGSFVPSCSSHVGTIPIYHFEKWMIFQSWLVGSDEKKNKKKTPTSENVKYLKLLCCTFFQKPWDLLFFFCQGKI